MPTTYTLFVGLGPYGNVTEQLLKEKLDAIGPYSRLDFPTSTRRKPAKHAWVHCSSKEEAELIVKKLGNVYIGTSRLNVQHATEDQQAKGTQTMQRHVEIVDNWATAPSSNNTTSYSATTYSAAPSHSSSSSSSHPSKAKAVSASSSSSSASSATSQKQNQQPQEQDERKPRQDRDLRSNSKLAGLRRSVRSASASDANMNLKGPKRFE